MGVEQSNDWRELDTRVSDGLEVQLLWSAAKQAVEVRVNDTRTGAEFTLPIGEEQRARDVFMHPFAYAAETPQAA